MKDIIGQAIHDYHHRLPQPPLWVCYEDGAWDEMRPAVYFRPPARMPPLERKAIRQCCGRILEIGAGAGSHALLLQSRGLEVTALDISPKAVEVMRLRGVQQTVCADIFQFEGSTWDTLLLLMNGIGLAGTLPGLRRFLQQARRLLNPGGQLLFDSSDVAYLYDADPPPADPYYGEVRYRYLYGEDKTDWDTWLYIDRHTLAKEAAADGWHTRVLFDDGDDQYLARLTLIS